MIKINMISPMVSKVIERSTGNEVVVDYELYEYLRANELGFNTLYCGIPLDMSKFGLNSLDKINENILHYYSKEQKDRFNNTVTRYGNEVYVKSYFDVDYGFFPHWEKDTMFFAFWYTDAGDSSSDYIPHIITSVKYQHQAEYLLEFYKSLDFLTSIQSKTKNILEIPNEE